MVTFGILCSSAHQALADPILDERLHWRRGVTPTFIGYFPKCTAQRPAWLEAAGVEEIGSVSTCISTEPAGWVDQWLHNAWWVYDTEAVAWSVVPAEARPAFDLYAYALFPVRFAEGRQEPIDLPALQVQPLPASFVRLGYDAVSRSSGTTFECSPLSCNGQAQQVAVNRYCLVETAQQAFALAHAFSVGTCEPGPYYVIEVWRQPRQTAEPGAASGA